MAINTLREFIKLESSSSLILFVAAVIALLAANSNWQALYYDLFNYPLLLGLGHFKFSTSLLHLINEGLMTIFFLLVSLEVKRELLVGELNSRAKALLPVIAAIGGMVAPALIFTIINFHQQNNLNGWAIPTATDIAFSLAVLSLLGNRIPRALKAFLTALAIIDDLGAIVIIALFYTAHINVLFLLLSLCCLFVLLILNYLNSKHLWQYSLVGILLWVCVINSGVHATIAGVILGLTIPLQTSSAHSPLQVLEHKLHPWVAFMILPLFALANAGLSLTGMHGATLIKPLPLGIILGLFLGKQLGIFSASWLAIKTKLVKLPARIKWRQLYGVSLICGMGFTMSLFIGTLAFSDQASMQLSLVRLGVIIGSLLSAVAGYLVLRL